MKIRVYLPSLPVNTDILNQDLSAFVEDVLSCYKDEYHFDVCRAVKEITCL